MSEQTPEIEFNKKILMEADLAFFTRSKAHIYIKKEKKIEKRNESR